MATPTAGLIVPAPRAADARWTHGRPGAMCHDLRASLTRARTSRQAGPTTALARGHAASSVARGNHRFRGAGHACQGAPRGDGVRRRRRMRRALACRHRIHVLCAKGQLPATLRTSRPTRAPRHAVMCPLCQSRRRRFNDTTPARPAARERQCTCRAAAPRLCARSRPPSFGASSSSTAATHSSTGASFESMPSSSSSPIHRPTGETTDAPM